jgi:hypothetical protein
MDGKRRKKKGRRKKERRKIGGAHKGVKLPFDLSV